MRASADSRSVRAAWMRALERTAVIERDTRVTLVTVIDRLAERHTDAPALVAAEATLSYRELGRRTSRYARWALARGLGPGATVALLAPTCAEYLPIWLGITRTGASVALVNPQLTGEALAHAIRIVAPRHVVVDASLGAAFAAVRDRLDRGLVAWALGDTRLDFASLSDATAAIDPAPLAASECEPPTLDQRALFIYTSGTSGLPKAANVTHFRLMQWSHWFAGLLDTRPEDRMYNCLPLYHSVGGVVALGATLLGGGTVVLRGRFSATDFWRDVRAERCTLFQYIGELCRYLVNSEVRPDERAHALRIACGNGLRPEVWQAFQSRFAIPQILEYYAATEGTFSLYNLEGEPGSIGRTPAFLAHRQKVELVRFDVGRGEAERDADGRCQRCAPDEVGEAIALVPPAGTGRGGRFEGYADADASERKLMRDVFSPGDLWYRTGDLMRRDARGFFYFVDRIGDTYRWKGENVSTTEVVAALTTCAGVIEAAVYGVRVPGHDGRAGMAALVVDARFDVAGLFEALTAQLPGYAVPAFIRVLSALEATGTFKPKKQELVAAGFDPAVVEDPLWVADREARVYAPLDAARHAAIVAGAVRL